MGPGGVSDRSSFSVGLMTGFCGPRRVLSGSVNVLTVLLQRHLLTYRQDKAAEHASLLISTPFQSHPSLML